MNSLWCLDAGPFSFRQNLKLLGISEFIRGHHSNLTECSKAVKSSFGRLKKTVVQQRYDLNSSDEIPLLPVLNNHDPDEYRFR